MRITNRDNAGSAPLDEGAPEIKAIWSRSALISAYTGLFLLCYVTSLEMQVTTNLTVFATSAFRMHSKVSTIYVVQSISFSILKPVAAKFADVFGRFEAFTLCIIIFVLGYLGQAFAGSIKSFAAFGVPYSAGASGLQILAQIFIADTSDLRNRAILSNISDVPFLVNVWIGAPIAGLFLQGAGWRWGYGVWAVVLPLTYLPLAVSLLGERLKLRQQRTTTISLGKRLTQGRSIIRDMDAIGLSLLSTAICLMLLPLTLARDAADVLGNKSTIVMLFFGLVCLILFPLWERNPRLAPSPFFPPHLFRNRTVLAGLAIPLVFSAAYYLCVFPYFQSYLLVVRGEAVTAAGHIVQIYIFVASISAVLVSFMIKYTKRYKIFVVLGSLIYCLGIFLSARYRTAEAYRAIIIGCQVIIGIGGGLLIAPAQLGVQASVQHADVAATTALFLTVLEIGGAIGSAIAGAIWTQNVLPKLQQYLPRETVDEAAAIFGNVTIAATSWPPGSPTKDAIDQAYQETMTKLLTAAVVVCLPLIPLSLMLKDYRLDEDHDYSGVGQEEEELADMNGAMNDTT